VTPTKVQNLQSVYDVVVLGGGPSGSTAAANLVRQSLSVLIVEEQEATSFKVGESMPGVAARTIARAGYPDVLSKIARLKCSGNRSAWGSSVLQFRPGLLDPYGGGFHLDRAQFDQELLCEAVAAGAQLLRGARFQKSAGSGKGWTVFLRHRETLRSVVCGSVIDCTGRRACFARAQGAKRVAMDKQVAIVSVLSENHVTDADLTTTIETTCDGWWYSARIPNDERVVVFFCDGDLLPELGARSYDGFTRLMRRSTHIREFLAGDCSIKRGPWVELGGISYLGDPAGDGWCAAGDAAVAVDPLASIGIIDAIDSGAAAAQVVLLGFKNVDQYVRTILGRVRANIETRQSYYSMELRWSQAPFWARRCGRLADSSNAHVVRSR
jgi:flavin-dependent dehydrogenase